MNAFTDSCDCINTIPNGKHHFVTISYMTHVPSRVSSFWVGTHVNS